MPLLSTICPTSSAPGWRSGAPQIPPTSARTSCLSSSCLTIDCSSLIKPIRKCLRQICMYISVQICTETYISHSGIKYPITTLGSKSYHQKRECSTAPTAQKHSVSYHTETGRPIMMGIASASVPCHITITGVIQLLKFNPSLVLSVSIYVLIVMWGLF